MCHFGLTIQKPYILRQQSTTVYYVNKELLFIASNVTDPWFTKQTDSLWKFAFLNDRLNSLANSSE